jgi:hypothetical protein
MAKATFLYHLEFIMYEFKDALYGHKNFYAAKDG